MNIWSNARFPHEDRKPNGDTKDWRSEHQHDHDRLLFSAPVRRLADKTQVWPMDQNDGVRTRLTHSHEVANLTKSIGTSIATSRPDLFAETNLYNTVQPVLSAIGLAHDLGNPPFGHQGEAAIGKWFLNRKSWIFDKHSSDGKDLDDQDVVPDLLHDEFLKFDGNPQTFRLITRLQTHRDYLGLDFTAATLAASLKYPVGPGSVDPDNPVFKKAGYFASESEIVDWVRKETGLEEKQRHPLTWIMEACDDIAYSILDVDDVMKKKIVSPDDVLAVLDHDDRFASKSIVGKIKTKFRDVMNQGRDPHVARDIKIGLLRAYLIRDLIQEASSRFIDNSATIMSNSHTKPLMEGSELCDVLQSIAKLHAFNNPAVLKMEALGAEALDGLMTFFWDAIDQRKKFAELDGKRTSARAKFGWSIVSPNYIEAAVRRGANDNGSSGVRYRELRLLTDMISGMTDTFALNLWAEVRAIPA